MNLVYIGLVTTGLIMAIYASQAIPTLIRYLRKPIYGQRTGPKAVVHIQVHKKENQDEY